VLDSHAPPLEASDRGDVPVGSVRGRSSVSTSGPTQLRAAIVGCGTVAANHARAYRAASGVDLVACCDPVPGRAAAFAARHGIEAAVGDMDALLDLGADVVSVCTPHPTHEAVVLAAAARGVHVLCEKPIAVDLSAGLRMVEACEAAGVILGVAFQRRFWPAARRIRAAIEDGTVGIPVLGHASVLLHRDTGYYTADAWRGTWATDGGGVLMTQAIHHLDLLMWFMGDVVEVSARAATFAHADAIEVEDTLVATLRYAGGGLATLSASTALAPGLGAQVRITGTTGATVGLIEYPEGTEAVTDLWAVPGQLTAAPSHPAGIQADPSLPEINAGLAPFHAALIDDFVRSVRTGTPPAVTGREALRSLGIVTAVYASAASGAPEPVPALRPREDPPR
jgi:UDP-N-acetyl-2-amino-2-deoxyglucuronate dehydrogenase